MLGAVPEPRTVAADPRLQAESWTKVAVGLLEKLEAEEATGLARFTVRGTLVGTVICLDGRVCLADSAGPADLFRNNPSVLRLARRARDSGETFSATVFEQESSLAGDLRAQVLERTGRGLRLIAQACTQGDPKVHLVPASNDYDRRLSYGAVEVLAAAVGRPEIPDTELATKVFDRIRDSAEGALLFDLEPPVDGPSVPVDHFGLVELGLRELRPLLRASREILRPVTVSGRDRWSAARWCVLRSRGVPWVLVRGDAYLVLASCPRPGQVGLVLGSATYTAGRRPTSAD